MKPPLTNSRPIRPRRALTEVDPREFRKTLAWVANGRWPTRPEKDLVAERWFDFNRYIEIQFHEWEFQPSLLILIQDAQDWQTLLECYAFTVCLPLVNKGYKIALQMRRDAAVSRLIVLEHCVRRDAIDAILRLTPLPSAVSWVERAEDGRRKSTARELRLVFDFFEAENERIGT